MDCDTTGVEPDLGLVKTKKLVGGGTMSIVNQTVPRALRRLGYSEAEVDGIVGYIDEHKTIVGAPDLDAAHLPVFACSMGDNTIHYVGHVRMMGAVQPFISGAISKTVNMPEDVTVEDVEQLHIDAWRLGIKAVAIYRDNCKVAQPLSTTKKGPRRGRGHRHPGSAAEATDRELAAASPSSRRRSCTSGNASRAGGGRRGARAAAPTPALQHLRLPGRRLRGLRDRRRVRGRPSRRGLHEGLQAGLDPGRDHGRLLDLDQPGPPARGPAGHLRAQVLEHEVRAGRHHRRSRAAHRHQPGRLHLPSPRPRLPHLRGAGRARRALDRRSGPSRPSPGSRRGHAVGRSGRRGDRRRGARAVEPAPAPAVEEVPVTLARAEQRDAPYCYNCGNAMQRAGSCYVCASCGSTSGCS